MFIHFEPKPLREVVKKELSSVQKQHSQNNEHKILKNSPKTEVSTANTFTHKSIANFPSLAVVKFKNSHKTKIGRSQLKKKMRRLEFERRGTHATSIKIKDR